MADFWRALGRGFIKVLVSLLAGFGVGLLVIGNVARDQPQFWESRNPPAGLFISIGAGLLTAAGLLIVLFFVPWLWHRPSRTQEPRKHE